MPFSGGQDSFSKFTMEMVRQYMKEEEMRAAHQSSLLRLREKALKEKTKAELAWLEHQKKYVLSMNIVFTLWFLLSLKGNALFFKMFLFPHLIWFDQPCLTSKKYGSHPWIILFSRPLTHIMFSLHFSFIT